MARLQQVLGSLSSATALKFSTVDSSIVEMLHLVSITDDFADLSAWTEVDSTGTNVNVSGGVVTMNGSSARGANGIVKTTGITLAEGYLEIKFKVATLASNVFDMQIAASAAIPATLAGQICQLATSSSLIQSCNSAGNTVGNHAYTADTYYTLRIYVLMSSDGVTWKAGKITLQGGSEYPTETEVLKNDFFVTAVTNPFYPVFQRFLNSAGNLTSIKEFRWYSGYSTLAPYVEYVIDAGAGKVHDNFDPTALALPGTVPSTNLTFKWSFDDGVASYSSALTLAQLNAVGKQTARYRYIRLQVLLNSDGATQVYAAMPNSDTATDGVGDFADVGNVRETDTSQGTTGTLLSNKILKSNATGSGAGNWNDDNLGVGSEANVSLGTAYGLSQTGTLSAGGVPTAPTIKEIKNITESSAIVVLNLSPNAASYKVYRDGTLVASGVTDIEYTLTGLAPNTLYSITAKGTNGSGDSAASAASTFTTRASSGTAAITSRSAATVAVVTVSGYPKIVGSGSVKVFDPRVIGNAVSEATADYYWKDINENNGKSVLPGI